MGVLNVTVKDEFFLRVFLYVAVLRIRNHLYLLTLLVGSIFFLLVSLYILFCIHYLTSNYTFRWMLFQLIHCQLMYRCEIFLSENSYFKFLLLVFFTLSFSFRYPLMVFHNTCRVHKNQIHFWMVYRHCEVVGVCSKGWDSRPF